LKRVIVIGAAISALVMLSSANATAGLKSFWTGKNSQREPLSFLMGKSHGVKYFSPLDTIFDLTCPVIGEEITAEFFFFGFHKRM